MLRRRSGVAQLFSLGHESYFEIFWHWLAGGDFGLRKFARQFGSELSFSMILASQLCKLVVSSEVG